ncbi:MAG: nucleotide exchange factor GrpE [Parcubacteria group bacterium CG_4_9_14_0_2_um_filter_41_8]|nr:MAG: nucleotide exchange factor GrpE [Parcubacteria group bacterium CG1_02_41_12]PIZ81796.1 MAG: nucleotide exchange factor GrpE [Parcubacteria group bacterium CG_4_10_14_0_2_um_filter_41_6]PJC40708.1 MAG: nucleotide exchange factor GrpE [Parcubacteria group bacterium CG_4_9_14_0_2_um_filter_41_8]
MKTDKKFTDLEAKAEEYLAGWKRAQADYQNLQKEHKEQMGRIGEIGAMGFVEHLLPIIDHFDLAIAHVPDESKDKEWVQGFFHIKKQFDEVLENLGVKRINAIGKKFDPNFHEAVSQKESKQESDTVIQEVQAGYRFGESVIRHAKVVVSK